MLSSNVATLAKRYDIVIVGGGLVGFAFTALMTSHPMLNNKKILLIDRGKNIGYEKKTEYLNRVVAITPESRNILSNVGAWKFVEEGRYQVVKKMKVYELGSNGYIKLHRKNPLDDLAYIIENDLILSSLKKITSMAAKQSYTPPRPGCIEVIYQAEANNFIFPKTYQENTYPQFKLKYPGNEKPILITSSILIGADGSNSKVRDEANIHFIGWKHDQCAIVANLNMTDDYDCTTAWQRFIGTGPIALLPLGPGKCSLVWSTTGAEAARMMALECTTFVGELNHALSRPVLRRSSICDVGRWLLTKAEPTKAPTVVSIDANSRAAFPLTFRHSTFYHAPRVALIGDAAHRILPLTGQGVNMGFGDAEKLALNLNAALLEGADIACPRYLSDYTSERQRSVVPMAAFVEALHLLFSSDATVGSDASKITFALRKLASISCISSLISSARGFGMNLLDSNKCIKDFLVESAATGRVRLSLF